MIDISMKKIETFFNVEVSVLILNMKWYRMCELKVIRKNFSRYQYLIVPFRLQELYNNKIRYVPRTIRYNFEVLVLYGDCTTNWRFFLFLS